MLVIFLLIFISLTLAVTFLAAFIWAVKSGQFEDTCTPSMRMLLQDREPGRPQPALSQEACARPGSRSLWRRPYARTPSQPAPPIPDRKKSPP
jgi:cbb3-type cytochrome oxidase maturation protein